LKSALALCFFLRLKSALELFMYFLGLKSALEAGAYSLCTFFLSFFANLWYVCFVPGGNHLGIACFFHD
jgi:hypothetical protein